MPPAQVNGGVNGGINSGARRTRNDAFIENPLRTLNDRDLRRDVRDFATRIEFTEELQHLQRGAHLAKYSSAYERAARTPGASTSPLNLTASEKTALRNEKERLFTQSRDMIITIITCATAALVQGWDQTGSNGANLTWPDIFPGVDRYTSKGNWIIGLVNAGPYISASLIGCLLTDPINSYFGRRGTIFFAGLWCFASVIGSAFTQRWETLLAARLCLGIGMGAKASTVPVYAAEAAPSYFRGSIVLSWQLWVACGIFLGFTANLIVNQASPDVSWRLQLGSAMLPAVPLLILVYIAPESPRWYMKKGGPENYRKAFAALQRLRNTPLQAYRDFYFMHKQLELEQRAIQVGIPDAIANVEVAQDMAPSLSSNIFSRFGQLFTVPRIRRATVAANSIMLVQQLCGINILAFYSSTLFKDTLSDERLARRPDNPVGAEEDRAIIRKALLFSWGFGLINTLFALPAVRTIDKYGRRPLALFSTANMAWTLLAAGLCFKITSQSGRAGTVAFFLFLFAAFYSPGIGPVPFTYSAEAYPLSHREIGMSLSVATNLFFAAVLTVCFPRLDRALGHTGTLGLFAAFNVVAFLMVLLWMPETAQKTLEGLTRVFDTKTRDHMQYQIVEVVPWFFVRLSGRKKKVLRDLYFDFDNEEPQAEHVALGDQHHGIIQPNSHAGPQNDLPNGHMRQPARDGIREQPEHRYDEQENMDGGHSRRFGQVEAITPEHTDDEGEEISPSQQQRQLRPSSSPASSVHD